MKYFDGKKMRAAYAEAIQFTERPDDQDECETWDRCEFSPSFDARNYQECSLFENYLKKHFPEFFATVVEHGAESQVGHDFWLTRNGHGAGFWDRTPKEYPNTTRETLREISDACSDIFGEVSVYVNDNDDAIESA